METHTAALKRACLEVLAEDTASSISNKAWQVEIVHGSIVVEVCHLRMSLNMAFRQPDECGN
eukprot:1968522-Amphidinium_carterae.5